ncbi:MAG: hypothetical protein OXI50_02105, partial [Gammaproteobacteria bacterium]|nr:hypothetical protein [Gammaproteobacteria bacterium]
MAGPPKTDGGESIDLVLRWGREHGRSFPWRSERGFRLAVAEVLLQKTRGATVEGVWRALLEAYPDARSLAGADPSDVEGIVGALGLGTQRAGRLIAMARSCSQPARYAARGLGPYGQGVVRLASGELPEVAPVDGNVARVISRLHGWTFERGEPRKKPEVRKAVMDLLGAARVNSARKVIQFSARKLIHL